MPAVKDAATEQVEVRNSALGKLLERTVRTKGDFADEIQILQENVRQEYESFLNKNQYILSDLSIALQKRISEWAHPDVTLRLQWKQDPERSVRIEKPWAHLIAGEGDFEGEISRFGHGLQRSYLLALLQELAGTTEIEGPTLILACEEPELYQHPPQARHLAGVLNELSQKNAQVMVSTHDPLFVSGKGFPDVRMVRKHPDQQSSTVSHMSLDKISEEVASATGDRPSKPEGILAKIHQILQSTLG